MVCLIGKNKRFYFFKTLAGSVFIAFIGIFVTLWMIFFTLTLVFFNQLYHQFAFFLFWGAVTFSISYYLYLRKYEKVLKNLNYEAFIIARNKLISWLFWTFNAYLMSCWFLLILIGAFHGFGFNFPIGDQKGILLYSTAKVTKITGLILWCVHIFCILLMKLLGNSWKKIILLAHMEFVKRRKILEEVREEAKTQI